jgi:hypothetical protein
MEYLLGSLITLFVGFVFYKMFSQEIEEIGLKPIAFSQSHMHQLLFPVLPTNGEIARLTPKNTQSQKYVDQMYIDIIVFEEKAYWIKDNAFMSAEIIDGVIEKDSANKVDTMAMDKIQLDKMAHIVELLTKGEK